MKPEAIARVFLTVIVPIAKKKFGAAWLSKLKEHYPVISPPEKISMGLSEESAKQILRLGYEAADYFEGLAAAQSIVGNKFTERERGGIKKHE